MSKSTISRRQFLISTGAITSAACLGLPHISKASGESKSQLTMVTWGGTTEQGYKKFVAAPFTKKTDIPVRVTAPVDYGKYIAQLKRGKIKWNWVDIEGWFAHKYKEYWLDDLNSHVGIDYDQIIDIPGRADIPSWAIPSSTSYAFAIAYRTDYPRHPKNWKEFFDVDSVPGIRSIYNWPYGILEATLLGDGVPFDSLYPLDVDRALNKLDNIRSHLIFWNSGAELQHQLAANTARFAFAWNNRAAYLARNGQPVDLEWQGNIQGSGLGVVAKEDPALHETVKLLKFMMSPEVDSQLAISSGYSPMTHDAFDLIPKNQQKWFSAYGPNLAKASGYISNRWWAKNLDKVAKKWNLWASS